MKRLSQAGVLSVAVIGLLAVLPPAVQRARRQCPVRPDGVSEASAMPQFARRYGVECSVCHTTVPELTVAGYKFRRAGYRMPDEIGAEAKFTNIGDMYSARIREQFKVNASATDGTAANAKVPASNQFVFHEFTFYPISGAFGKYWSSLSELTVGSSGAGVELENAYIRATYPLTSDAYLTARAGIFHPFEGYGGSDRTISNLRPAFQGTAVGPFSGLGTKVWGQDQEGLEVGGTWKDSNLTVAVLNGYDSTKNAANEGEATGDNNRDFLIFFNQFIGENAAISAEYLNGKTPYAYAGAGNDWINNYQKGAVYANYKVLGDKLNILGGYGINKDHKVVGTDVSGTFNSTGWYVTAESKMHEHLTGVLRYDTFNPNTQSFSGRTTAWTATAAIPFDQVKFLVDYQLKRTKKSAGKDRTDNTLAAEWMVIF